MNLVTTDWLESHLDKVKIFDASWHMPSTKRSPKKEYDEKHIRGAMFWDVNEHSDKESPYPHMMTDSNYWKKMLMSFGIKNEELESNNNYQKYTLSIVLSTVRLPIYRPSYLVILLLCSTYYTIGLLIFNYYSLTTNNKGWC